MDVSESQKMPGYRVSWVFTLPSGRQKNVKVKPCTQRKIWPIWWNYDLRLTTLRLTTLRLTTGFRVAIFFLGTWSYLGRRCNVKVRPYTQTLWPHHVPRLRLTTYDITTGFRVAIFSVITLTSQSGQSKDHIPRPYTQTLTPPVPSPKNVVNSQILPDWRCLTPSAC